MKREFVLTEQQNVGLIAAARSAEMSIDAFIIAAVRNFAARHGVEIPATPEKRVKSSGVTLIKKTGRPRQTATHSMDRHVPAGMFAGVCPHCKRDFRFDDDRIVFCSLKCEKDAQNKRNYQRRKSRTK